METDDSERFCYICGTYTSETIQLDAVNNKILRQNLESALEESLNQTEICYPCKNKFESALHSMVLFKNQYHFKKKDTETQSSMKLNEPVSCCICGQTRGLNFGQYVSMADKKQLLDNLHVRSSTILIETEEVIDDYCCSKCFRMLKKLEWIESELIQLISTMEKSYIAEKEKKEKEFLISARPAKSFVLSNVFFVVGESNVGESAKGQLPQHALVSRLAIDRLKTVGERVEFPHVINVNGIKYVSYKQIQDCGAGGAIVSISGSKLQISLDPSYQNAGQLSCSLCPFSSPYLYMLISHLQTSHGYPLPEHQLLALNGSKDKLLTQQQLNSTSQSKLSQNLSAEQLAKLVLYRCPYCQQEFDRKSDFKSHNFVCKSGMPTVVSEECTICNKLFRSKESLAVHISRDHEGSKKPWSCSLCNKEFTRKASYEEHVNRHKGIKDRKCEICNKYFYETSYWRHMKIVHATTESLKFSCDVCHKQFSQRFKLKQHSLTHMPKDERLIKCTDAQCDKMFATPEKLRNHLKTVHDNKFSAPLVCGECGATYSKLTSICSHQRQCHGPDSIRPLPCPHCPQTFRSASALNKHITVRHKPPASVEPEDQHYVLQHRDDDLQGSLDPNPDIRNIQFLSTDNTDTDENLSAANENYVSDDNIVFIELEGAEEDTRLAGLHVDDIEPDMATQHDHDGDEPLLAAGHGGIQLTIAADDLLSHNVESGMAAGRRHDLSLHHSAVDHQEQPALSMTHEDGIALSYVGPTELREQDVTEQSHGADDHTEMQHVDMNRDIVSIELSQSCQKPDFISQVINNHSLDSKNIERVSSSNSRRGPLTAQHDIQVSSAAPPQSNPRHSQGEGKKWSPVVLAAKPKIYLESVLLSNSSKQLKRTSSSIISSGITTTAAARRSFVLPDLDDDNTTAGGGSLPHDFPPLPSSPPDTLLDEPSDGVVLPNNPIVSHSFAAGLNIADNSHLGDGSDEIIRNRLLAASQSLDIDLTVPSLSRDKNTDDENITTEDENFYKCLNCQRLFIDSDSLTLHDCRRQEAPNTDDREEYALESLDQQVVNKKKFECDRCKKLFSTKKVLKRHYRIHTGDKPYTCEFCNKSFGAPSNLSEHRTLHTGRMAYSCNVCGNKFRLWSTLNKHRVKCEAKTT